MDLSPEPQVDDITASAWPLPTLRILLKQENLEIVVTPSLCLDLPARFANVLTIDQLCVDLEESHLWIARTGNCHIEVSVAVHGNPVLEVEQLGSFARSIKHCDVWNRLGLHLEHEPITPTQLPGLISLSIQHPSLASALIPPTGAATAQFRALILSVNVLEAKLRPPPNPGPKERTKKRKRTHRGTEDTPAASEHEEMSSALGMDDQLAVENFIMSLNFPLQSSTVDQSIYTLEIDPNLTANETLDTVNKPELVTVMFEQLMLAPTKKYKEVRVTCGLSSRCLTKLAPGVFHIPYLKAISDRADFLKVIGGSLARMRNAESPGLRQKITELNLRSARDQTLSTECDGIIQGIEKRTWEVLVMNAKLPTLRERAGRQREQSVQPELEKPSAVEDRLPIHASCYAEEAHLHVKQEDTDSSQGVWDVNESLLPEILRVSVRTKQ
ncbi:hypothetical protein EDB81DRAFT_880457 [Dactylonectria macrodidyma]|uniref:Uncharacterized protein n=1 Tax=Dactylonectria macrodidyma TaxID=307937 RepID=A0A9P9F940_9HYPO|nr:hypothetical protein EDB81DRAFT_880457 [Dactylonectria macrodidyma]